MLTLKNITKTYQTGTLKLGALDDVTLSFRKSEFVSILGPSGCGKTTMLNIVGGLDRYTSGDLIIDGRSTKDYTDKDWDTYRNHKVGFVFQSYNLIPHQTVLQNVELALTLSGVDKKERKERAIEALTKVGLADKIKSRPNQLSGGQMQRVAIARALVNDPEIVLADEPTGALDTESSLQIMELLKEISKDKLIVMVTHNPELAEKYSTRIVRLLDGKVQSDTMPFDGVVEEAEEDEVELEQRPKKKRMSFFTAMALSFKNLLTKKARTMLVAFAGSIGIIGIALILAISSGFSGYVDKMQKDTLGSYPISISNNTYDMNSLMQVFFSSTTNEEVVGTDKVYTKNELTTMLKKFNTSTASNDLKSFKTYLEGDGKTQIEGVTTAIQYVYNVGVNAYYNSTENGLVAVNPSTVFADKISAYPLTHPLTTQDQQTRYGLLNMMFGSKSSFYSNEFWAEMINNQDFLNEQYDLVGEGSEWADSANEIMIIINENNQITDYTLFGLGLLNQDNLDVLLDAYVNNTQEITEVSASFEYADLLGLEYKIIMDYEYFEAQPDGTYLDIRTLKTTNPTLYQQKIAALYEDANVGVNISVAGIIKPKANVTSTSIDAVVGYTEALTKLLVEKSNQSEIIQAQLTAGETKNVITNAPFEAIPEVSIEKQYLGVLSSLGYVDLSNPEEINIFPTKFEDKEVISQFISDYNASVLASGEGDKVISYSDTVGTMMASISLIISAITYVLIAFVGVSLVVSSIMIGIITYISVIERTKEIGVLRSVGASKKDVKRVFTAESFIVGFSSGLFGIIVSLLLIIPINILLAHFTAISGMANLPILGSVILVAVSVVLTLIAGLIPARIAAKKDPVVALRSE